MSYEELGGSMSRRSRAVRAVLLGSVLVIAACSNSDDDDAAPAETAAATTEAAAPETTAAADTTAAAAETTTAAAAETTTAATEAPDERDTFVALEGVPGVSDTEIKVAVIGTKANNPLGTCILDCYVTGIQAYFDYINSEGGIYGRQLVIGDTLDDELANNQARALDVIADNDAFAAFSATLVASGWGDLADAGIPTFTWNIHANESAGQQALFGHVAGLCADCSQRILPWAAASVGATKAASLGYGISENSKVCAQTTAASFDKYAAETGVENVYVNDDLAFGLPDGIGPQVTEMINAGVDFISTCMDLNGMKTLAQELERQGVRDKIVMYHPNTYDRPFVAAAEGLFDGDMVAPQFAALEYTGVPAMATLTEWVDKQGGPQAEQTVVGWINAHSLVAGLLAAGPEFDRAKVIDGLNSLTAYNADGLINPINWSTQHTPPTEGDPANDYLYECVSLVRMQGDGFVPVSDLDKPFLCWDNATLDYAEPMPMSFND